LKLLEGDFIEGDILEIDYNKDNVFDFKKVGDFIV